MISNKLFIIVIFCGLIAYTTCQTFQYSRGWTNGKRGGAPFQLLDQNNEQIRSFGGAESGNGEHKYERLLHHLRQMAIFNENQKKNSPTDYDVFEPMPSNEERYRRDAASDRSNQ